MSVANFENCLKKPECRFFSCYFFYNLEFPLCVLKYVFKYTYCLIAVLKLSGIRVGVRVGVVSLSSLGAITYE